jgi:hypothetical protein
MRHSTVSNLFCVFSSATKAAAGVGRLDGGGGSPPRPITPAPCYRCRCCGVTARAPSFRPRCRGSFLLTCFSSGHACQRVTEQGIHPADEQSQTSSRPVTAMMRFPPAGYFGSGRLQPLFTGWGPCMVAGIYLALPAPSFVLLFRSSGPRAPKRI